MSKLKLKKTPSDRSIETQVENIDNIGKENSSESTEFSNPEVEKVNTIKIFKNSFEHNKYICSLNKNIFDLDESDNFIPKKYICNKDKKNFKKTKTIKKKCIKISKNSSYDDLKIYSKYFLKACNQNNINNPDDLQLAIALSQSLVQNQNILTDNSDSEIKTEYVKDYEENSKSLKIKKTLEEFGFKSTSIYTIKSNKKFKKNYPLIKKSDSEKSQIINNKISQLLFDHITPSLNAITNITYEVSSDVLKEITCSNKCCFLKHSLSYRDTHSEESIYYVKDLIEPSKSKVGCLLKNWSTIPGREKSPERNICNFNWKEKMSSEKDVDTLLSGKINMFQAFLCKEKEKCPTIESNKDFTKTFNSDTPNKSNINRSNSPDIFNDSYECQRQNTIVDDQLINISSSSSDELPRVYLSQSQYIKSDVYRKNHSEDNLKKIRSPNIDLIDDNAIVHYESYDNQLNISSNSSFTNNKIQNNILSKQLMENGSQLEITKQSFTEYTPNRIIFCKTLIISDDESDIAVDDKKDNHFNIPCNFGECTNIQPKSPKNMEDCFFKSIDNNIIEEKNTDIKSNDSNDKKLYLCADYNLSNKNLDYSIDSEEDAELINLTSNREENNLENLSCKSHYMGNSTLSVGNVDTFELQNSNKMLNDMNTNENNSFEVDYSLCNRKKMHIESSDDSNEIFSKPCENFKYNKYENKSPNFEKSILINNLENISKDSNSSDILVLSSGELNCSVNSNKRSESNNSKNTSLSFEAQKIKENIYKFNKTREIENIQDFLETSVDTSNCKSVNSSEPFVISDEELEYSVNNEKHEQIDNLMNGYDENIKLYSTNQNDTTLKTSSSDESSNINCSLKNMRNSQENLLSCDDSNNKASNYLTTEKISKLYRSSILDTLVSDISINNKNDTDILKNRSEATINNSLPNVYLNVNDRINNFNENIDLCSKSKKSELNMYSPNKDEDIEIVETGNIKKLELNISSPNKDENFEIIKTGNITPLINYNSLSSPEITDELSKYGIKPLKRKRAVQILEHIYEQTHPLINIDEISNARKRFKIDKSNSIPESSSLEKENSMESTSNPGESNDIYKEDSNTIEIKELNCNPEDWIFHRKLNSKISGCAVPLHVAFHNYLSTRSKLTIAILKYEPIDIEKIHQGLKDSGWNYNPKDLMTFLDKKCITIKTSNKKSNNKIGKKRTKACK